MNNFKIEKAAIEHALEIEKIHLAYFAEIGEGVGAVENNLKRKESLAFVALDSSANVVGYILSATHGTQNYFEWFGVIEQRRGIAQALFKFYFDELKNQNVKESVLFTRNRFKNAIIFYIKSGYEIKGMLQGSDGDLMIQLRRNI